MIFSKEERKSVLFGKLRPGQDFSTTKDGRVSGWGAWTKCVSGETNARNGNSFKFFSDNATVWVSVYLKIRK